jgi:hypothetical protein
MADATEQRPAEERLARIQFQDKPEGPIAAAIIAGGIGAAALGCSRPWPRQARASRTGCSGAMRSGRCRER